jgi:surface antigen
MFRAILVSAPLLAAWLQAPALAQSAPDDTDAAPCELSAPKKRGSSIMGGLLGGLANRALGRTGTTIASYVPVQEFATVLTDAIACRLDAQEQKQAADATTEAVRGGVGTTSSWTSTSRADVSGSSTVTAQTASADGTSCMTVNDVIIVSGEETTVSKRMCRAPGASGYTVAV